MYYQTMDSPVGNLLISCNEDAITGIEYKEEQHNDTHPLLALARTQLDEYFTGKRMEFTLPLYYRGTPFQEKTWKGLLAIPFGETRTYSALAHAIGCDGGQRAVGGANNKNPISIVIPCHRVVAANGIGGYAPGIEPKEWLLAHEHNIKERGCTR